MCPFCVFDRSDPTYYPVRLVTVEVQPAEDAGEIVTFAFFLTTGLFPPFSDFFMEVLKSYQLKMVHMLANAVLVFAIFTHLCEAFVGVASFGGFSTQHCAADLTILWGVRFPVRNRHLYME